LSNNRNESQGDQQPTEELNTLEPNSLSTSHESDDIPNDPNDIIFENEDLQLRIERGTS
jgi:hypothetical protein